MTKKFAARFAAFLALASGGIIVSTASPAQAYIGLYRVSATSAANAASPKTITATCAAGDDLVSVGGRINNGAGDVLLTRAYLDPATGTTAIASGIEAIATGVPWSVEVIAVCAPAGALVNRTFQQSTSALNVNDKFQSTFCPAGDLIVGGGYFLDAANGDVSIDEVSYNVAMTALTVVAYDNNAGVGNYSLTTQAVCADPLPINARLTFLSANNPNSPKTQDPGNCPIGSQVSAVGTVVTGALGAASIATLNPRSALIVGESTVREVGAFAGNWNAEVQALCIG